MARYRLAPLFRDFDKTSSDLNNIVTRLALLSSTLERDVHIEGCFIRAVTAWENFLEEYFLRCMCSAETRGKSVLKPKALIATDSKAAFLSLLALSRAGNIGYLNWLDQHSLNAFANTYFHQNSRVHKIYESPDKLQAMTTIRNAIAHRSKKAIAEFEKYVTNQHGYLSRTHPSMAELLITQKRSNSKLIFVDLVDYYQNLADSLTK